jgi:ketosteroid isomerase-like protein
MDQSPVDVVKTAFERFFGGDVDGATALMHDDMVVEFHGPPPIAYAGTFKGRAGAARFFNAVAESVDINAFETEQHLCDGDTVTVTGWLDLTVKATGKPIKTHFAHVITVRDGKWSRFRDFQDSAAAVEAFTPDQN